MNITDWLKVASGWQRIWVIIVGISFVCHFLLWFVFKPDWEGAIDSRDKAARDTQFWYAELKSNAAACQQARDAIALAEATYKKNFEAFRLSVSTDVAEVVAQIGRIQAQLDAAESRLDTIRALQLENQKRIAQRRLSQLHSALKDYPVFGPSSSPPWAEKTAKNCKTTEENYERASDQHTRAHERAMEIPSEFFKVTAFFAVSWLASSALLYFTGWLVGWVYRGFKK